jgi:hypothetical protein
MTVQLKDEPKSKYILSPEEGRAYFEEAIPRILGTSAEEFLQRYDAGEYANLPDTPEHWPIERAIFLIPLARPDS